MDVTADSDNRVHPRWARLNPIWIFPQLIVPALHARGGLTMLRKLDLVSFDCGPRNPDLAVALYTLISTSPHLTTIAVENLEAPGPSLPSLEGLVLHFPYRTPPHSPREILKWTLPRLRSRTILSYVNYDTIPIPIPIPILAALGLTLTHPHMHDFTSCASRTLTSSLPALEHLVLHPHEFLNSWCPALFHESPSSSTTAAGHLHFRRLRFLDVWITNDPDAAMWDASRAAALLTHARARIAPAPARVLPRPAVRPAHDLPPVRHA